MRPTHGYPSIPHGCHLYESRAQARFLQIRLSGAHFSPRKIVRDGSKAVKANAAWRSQRTFPVPERVDSAGRVVMGAHLRIGGENSIAPRLHYHDAARAEHGMFVGYIGPRLTNTLTS